MSSMPTFHRFQLSFVAVALSAGFVLALSGCGNKNGSDEKKSSGGGGTPAVQTLTFPQTLQFTGVDSATRNQCQTPSRIVHTASEYCQVIQDDSVFGTCAREQRDRLFADKGCNQQVASELNNNQGGAIWCEALQSTEFEATGLASLYTNTLQRTRAGVELIQPGAGNGRSIPLGNSTVVVDQVTRSGSVTQARISIVQNSRSERTKTIFNTSVSPSSLLSMTDLDGKKVLVMCMRQEDARQQTPRVQPHVQHPNVILPQASNGRARLERKMKCEGTMKKTKWTREERFQSEEINVLEVVDGGGENIFNMNGVEVDVSVHQANNTSTVPFYRIQARGLGPQGDKEIETAAELSRNQTLEFSDTDLPNSPGQGFSLRVTCRLTQ